MQSIRKVIAILRLISVVSFTLCIILYIINNSLLLPLIIPLLIIPMVSLTIILVLHLYRFYIKNYLEEE